MLNRRRFIGRGFLAAIGTLLFPKILFSNPTKISSSLDYKPEPINWSNNEINVAWIGHATVLINFYGTIIITDPVLLERVGLYLIGSSFVPARLTPPALSIDEIPKPDIILLSHAHFDHMDYPTLKKITNKFPNQIDAITAYLT